jgi:hypothetical protein
MIRKQRDWDMTSSVSFRAWKDFAVTHKHNDKARQTQRFFEHFFSAFTIHAFLSCTLINIPTLVKALLVYIIDGLLACSTGVIISATTVFSFYD